MSEPVPVVKFLVDGHAVEAASGSSLAAALRAAGITAFRRSVTGEPRGPVCGMGVCFECRLTVDGVPHRLGCLTAAADGMEVRTGEP